MPLARIDLLKGKSVEYRKTVGDVIYNAMVDELKMPKNDRYQVIAEHDPENFVYDATFWGITRTEDVIFVQMTLTSPDFSTTMIPLENKQNFYKRVVDDLNARLGVRREDLFISLVMNGRDDWSFGNGAASLI